MPQTTVISLTQTELIELEEILVDEDPNEALRFLRQVIKKKVDASKNGHCRPPLDSGNTGPR